MKTILQFLACVFALTITNAQNINYLGTYSSSGVPDYLVQPGDVITPEFLQSVDEALPESQPVPEFNPQYITAGYDTDLKITSQTDVWVTYITEGAGYKNVLGYYTYDINNPPTSPPSDITIIFPNVSNSGSGGGLNPGDKVLLGNFSAGTGIGWVLIADGWRNSEVGSGNWTVFSNPDFNPESDPALKHHNVLIQDDTNERIVLGFEDIRRDNASCDHDFNDAIFYITAEPFSAISNQNLATVPTGDPTSSANDGGLESNGNLASLIAKRNYKREKDNTAKNTIYKQTKFEELFAQHKYSKPSGKAMMPLSFYMPSTGLKGTETSYISSPVDLLDVTNATDVIAIDMYNDSDNRVSSVLATTTNGEVYNHTKPVCDRLKGEELVDLRTVTLKGHQLILSSIKRKNGAVEHSVSFSVKIEDSQNELISRWNINDYPPGDYYNFQVWGATYAQLFSNINYIIHQFESQKSLLSITVPNVLPYVYVKTGSYQDGNLYLSLVNRENLNAIQVHTEYTTTETSPVKTNNTNISLHGTKEENIEINTEQLFDVSISISNALGVTTDDLYLADGPWALDYNTAEESITSFDVQNTNNLDESGSLYVERNPNVIGMVKNQVNLFRHLKAGNQAEDLSAYSSIEFKMNSTHDVELSMIPENMASWDDRLRYTIKANNQETEYVINFSDFENKNGSSVLVNNIKTIIFSVKGNQISQQTFRLDISEVKFANTTLSTNFISQHSIETFYNYPNPFTEYTTVKTPVNSGQVSLKVYDVTGRLIKNKTYQTDLRGKFRYENQNQDPGVYFYLASYNDKIFKGKFIIK